MRIFYLHHSAVAVVLNKALLIFDYYIHRPDKGMDQGSVSDQEIREADRVYVFVSHSHSDHYNPRVFEWAKINPNTTYILDATVTDTPKQGTTVVMNPGKMYSDGYIYVREFGSTDIGGSFYVECEGVNLFHAGDFNNWHWKDDGNVQYTQDMQRYFERELEFLWEHVDHIDFAFFPLDKRMGSDFDAGADRFIEKMTPQVFIPLHFVDFDDTEAYRNKKSVSGTNVLAVKKNGQQFI